MKLRLSLALALTLALIPAGLPGQTPRRASPRNLPASARKLISVNVTGSQRYTPEEIIAASGLQLGESVEEEDFKKASQTLGDSGAFSDVLYSYQYSLAGTKLDLQVSDGDQFVPARFDNLAWWPDEELAQKLRARVPLFKGQVPVAGSLADQVSDALQALLIERGVQARADYLRFAREDGPVEAILYSVAGINLRIRKIEFSGAAPSELPLLAAAARKLLGDEYLRSKVQATAQYDFRPVYLEHGYLKAVFGEPQARVVQETPQETLVDVSLPVVPGRQYRLAQIQWSGNTVFPVETLQPLLHLQPGQTANALQLDRDLEAVKKLYGTRGYMAASARPTPQFDDAQSSVTYQLEIHEGPVYRMGDLEIQGLDTRTTSRLQALWKLRGGDPYNSTYPRQFLTESVNDLLPLVQWSVGIHESLNDKEKTVDVTLHFTAKGSR